MSRPRLLALASILACATACTFDSFGLEGGSGAEDRGDSETAGDPTTSSSGDGDPSTSGDGDPSTSGDGDPSTSGDGDPSTSGDGDPSTSGDGDPSTGDGDPSTGDGDPSTSGDGDPDSGDGDPGDGDPGDGDPDTGDGDYNSHHYGPCPDDGDYPCMPDEYCHTAWVSGWHFCTTGCDSASDCNDSPNGNDVACITHNSSKRCFVSCESDPCPMDMSCKTIGIWPSNHKVCAYD
jgi:hypothetical protein